MIIERIKNIKSHKSELKKFGLSAGAGLSILGSVLFIRGKSYYFYFFIISSALFFFGLVLPVILKPIHKVLTALFLLIGWAVSGVILILLFYLVITPLGLLAHLFGKNFLDLKFKDNKKSYWIRKKAKDFDKKDCQYQF